MVEPTMGTQTEDAMDNLAFDPVGRKVMVCFFEVCTLTQFCLFDEVMMFSPIQVVKNQYCSRFWSMPNAAGEAEL